MRDVETAIKRQTDTNPHTYSYTDESSQRAEHWGGERERVTRPGSKEGTDVEPKPPSEPTPRKDRDLSV